MIRTTLTAELQRIFTSPADERIFCCNSAGGYHLVNLSINLDKNLSGKKDRMIYIFESDGKETITMTETPDRIVIQRGTVD